tara:strand:+ start:366 stop:1358 length:993 start_codon:yes stop_codon:yes gene_type:complete
MDFSKLKNKNILVTGGAGFIGSNLCEYLLKLGANVTCLDNFSTGYKNNIKNFLNNEKFRLIEGDIRNYNTCLKSTKKINYVLHQAALGSVPRSINDPLTTNEVNISGFLNIILASKENKIKRFIYAASSSTYGDLKGLPKVENKIGNPLSPYAVTKYVNEIYSSVFSKIYGINTIGLRYFNVFGKKQNIDGPYAAVIPKFIDKLINYEQPIINGDGDYSRDFTHINNVIIMNMLALTTENKKALNQVYNTALGDRTTILELFNLIKINLSKFDSKIEGIVPIFGPIRSGDVPHSQASIEKANTLLNYKPITRIEEGIKKTVDWFYSKYSN